MTLTKHAFTLEVLSKGHFEFGVGAGWLEPEFEVLDVSFEDRGRILDEFLNVFRKAQSEGIVGFEGEFTSFPRTGFHPVPETGGPRIWIGGHSGPAFRRVGEYGDGWIIKGVQPPKVRAARERIMDAWTGYQREGQPVIAVGYSIDNKSDEVSEPVPELADGAIEQVEMFRKAGASHIILDVSLTEQDSCLETIETFGETVIPHFSGSNQ